MNIFTNMNQIASVMLICLILGSCKNETKETSNPTTSPSELKSAVPEVSEAADLEAATAEKSAEEIEKAKKQVNNNKVVEASKTPENHVFSNLAVPNISVNGSVNKMLSGDFAKTGSLSSLKGKKHMYAVGEVANLKGNVQVINGRPYVSTKEGAEMVMEETFNEDTALLVYAEVERWKKIKIPAQVQTKGQLRIFLIQQARAMGIDVTAPFPFMIEGNMRKLNFTIMNWSEGNSKHDSARFFSSGYQAVMYNQDLELIGFYSEPEKGSYLMNGLPFHAHFVTDNKEFAGHIDDIFLGQGMSLKLPLK